MNFYLSTKPLISAVKLICLIGSLLTVAACSNNDSDRKSSSSSSSSSSASTSSASSTTSSTSTSSTSASTSSSSSSSSSSGNVKIIDVSQGWWSGANSGAVHAEGVVSYSPTAADQQLIVTLKEEIDLNGATIVFDYEVDPVYIDSGSDLQPFVQQVKTGGTQDFDCYIGNAQLALSGEHSCELADTGWDWDAEGVRLGVQAKGDTVEGTVTLTAVTIYLAEDEDDMGWPVAGNLIVNGDFEEDANGWLPSWGGGGSHAIEVSSDESHTGDSSLLVTGRTDTGSFVHYPITTVIEAGNVYAITAYAMHTNAATDALRINAKLTCGAVEGYPEVDTKTGVPGGEWTILEGDLTVPADCDVTEALIYFEQTSNDAPEIYIDSVSMVLEPI